MAPFKQWCIPQTRTFIVNMQWQYLKPVSQKAQLSQQRKHLSRQFPPINSNDGYYLIDNNHRKKYEVAVYRALYNVRNCIWKVGTVMVCPVAAKSTDKYAGFHLGTPSLSFLTLIQKWISNYTYHKVWEEMNYPFPNFKDTAVEVWECISNFIPHITVVTCPCWDLSWPMLVKGDCDDKYSYTLQAYNVSLWEEETTQKKQKSSHSNTDLNSNPIDYTLYIG